MAGDIETRVGDYVDAHADEMVGFLQQVVQSKSLWGEVAALEACGALLAAKMRDGGVRVERPDSGTPGAPNVLGRVGDASSGWRFLLCGHYDVYPPSKAWSFDPWSAPIRDGKVYGPGSTDMKGGTTAMTVAATVEARMERRCRDGGGCESVGPKGHRGPSMASPKWTDGDAAGRLVWCATPVPVQLV